MSLVLFFPLKLFSTLFVLTRSIDVRSSLFMVPQARFLWFLFPFSTYFFSVPARCRHYLWNTRSCCAISIHRNAAAITQKKGKSILYSLLSVAIFLCQIHWAQCMLYILFYVCCLCSVFFIPFKSLSCHLVSFLKCIVGYRRWFRIVIFLSKWQKFQRDCDIDNTFIHFSNAYGNNNTPILICCMDSEIKKKECDRRK